MTLIGIAAEELEQLVERAVRKALAERRGPELLTTEQAASVAGVKPKTIREWVSEGLPAKRRGRRLLISREALDAWGQDEARPTAELVSGLTTRTG